MDWLKQKFLRENFKATDNVGAVIDFTDSDAPVQEGRNIGANAQAGLVAIAMLNNGYMTVRDAMRILESCKKVSTDPGRRVREARSWIERQGLEIQMTTHGYGKSRWQGWHVVGTEEAIQNALYKLKGKMNDKA